MPFEKFLEIFPEIHLDSMQIACCRYLERTGRRFCVNFGYNNAEAIVWAELEAE